MSNIDEFKMRYVSKTEALEDELKLLSAQLDEGKQRFQVVRDELKRRRETRDEQPPMAVVTEDSLEDARREVDKNLVLKVIAMEAEQAKLVLEAEVAKEAQREAESRLAILAKKLSNVNVFSSEQTCTVLQEENDGLRAKLDEFEQRVRGLIFKEDENANLRDAVACMERDREIDRKEVETTLDAAQRQIAELSASRDHWMLEHKAASERIKTLEVQLSDAEKAGRDRAGQLTERIAELEQELESSRQGPWAAPSAFDAEIEDAE